MYFYLYPVQPHRQHEATGGASEATGGPFEMVRAPPRYCLTKNCEWHHIPAREHNPTVPPLDDSANRVYKYTNAVFIKKSITV